MATKFIILGIFFLLGFRLAHYLLRFFHHSRKLNQQIGYYFVILEILTWLTLVIWTLADVYRTMDSKLILVFGAVALVFSVPVYYLARDFIMGIYLKIQHKVEKGEHISIEALSGEIIKSGNLNLYIKNSQGLIHTIPYSKIATQTIVKLSLNPNLKKQNLTFSIPQGEETPDITAKLNKLIINTPWVALGQAPTVESQYYQDGQLIVSFSLFTLRNEYLPHIRAQINKAIANTEFELL